ncbi:uncharacterized protein HMPREF1541_07513 [Cyphellophora europaea CBS 101466]|uniref:Calcineurin-like phosphoesterase domain-containing protein n=1 Tax=Cyphellophora europaea (strain CBS 101466) TaxID=1220924 RepID=W2RNK9_CYPE1|nr:uncharacterized protein HMPREF1541_07513 [Cyphellophora europaea CBS 101466]ETN37890.1 hypothetical protein HMPREF1541_07513 [Cyphellophora europaea CBS 101466]
MYIQSLISPALRVVLPLAFLSTVYLYLYPVVHGCAFPSTDGSLVASFRDTVAQHFSSEHHDTTSPGSSLAPFRLLVLADPQIEGDSSLPKPEDTLVPRLRARWDSVVLAEKEDRTTVALAALWTIISHDVPQFLESIRKRIDLFGNDFYLQHIYRTLNWWSRPSHVTVLGDLIGSQWVSDDEFEWRGWRYWNRVFAGAEKVDESIITPEEEQKETIFAIDDEDWKKRIINIAGNHDIGYAGDISEAKIERFERMFGKVNWDIRFEYPTSSNETEDAKPPSLHMVVLNSMMLDTPALSTDIQSATYAYLNSVITHRSRPVEDKTSFSLTLTHLPLFKKAGVCVDPPHFDFWPNVDSGGVFHPHGLREQNHLSRHASEPGLLESIYGMKGDVAAAGLGKGRSGLILNGHDHEGCDTFHYIPVDGTWNSSAEPIQERKTRWKVSRWTEVKAERTYTGVREVTLRSMMGEFGGNAGLLSAWFDFGAGEWRYSIQTCKLGTQYIWWAVHILDLIAGALVVAAAVSSMISERQRQAQSSDSQKVTAQKANKDKKA